MAPFAPIPNNITGTGDPEEEEKEKEKEKETGGGGGSLYRVKDNLRNGGEFTAVFRILSRIL